MLTLLHTAPSHVYTFNTLLANHAPDIPVQHIVAEDLLSEARATGITLALTRKVQTTLNSAIAAGATVVLCTCSTLGACTETLATNDLPVLRVDRPMAERAVALGKRITVVAALASTLAPTSALIHECAIRANAHIDLQHMLCDSAWPLFEQGALEAYYAAIATFLRAGAADADVLVLAQASMAPAAALCVDLPMPILSSPHIGLEAAIGVYRTHAKQ